MSTATTVAFVAAIIIELVVPFVAGFWVEARLDIPWRAFWYGVLAYSLAELVLRMPLLSYLGGRIGAADDASLAGTLAWALVLALSTALVELAGRYLGFRYLFRDLGLTWENGVMFGLGMAAMESVVVVGLPTLLTLVSALSLSGMDPVALELTAEETRQLAETRAQLATVGVWAPLSTALGCLLTIPYQMGLAALVMQAFSERSRRWLWYSLALQFGVSLVASMVSGYSLLVLGVAAAGCGYWALRLRPRSPGRARTRS